MKDSSGQIGKGTDRPPGARSWRTASSSTRPPAGPACRPPATPRTPAMRAAEDQLPALLGLVAGGGLAVALFARKGKKADA
ncbi:hypothetical protein NKH18_00435 [Streptomyces sp. M10(2022)]